MMVSLGSLVLPLLIAAVVVFFASFVAWMVLPHHKPDFKKLPDEDRFFDSLSIQEISPGFYMFPFCKPEDMKNPDMQKRYAKGPWGSLNLLAAQPNFGKNLLSVFVFYVVVGIFVAYLGSLALPRGAEFGDVFQVTGTAAIMAYSLGLIPGAIFKGVTCRAAAMDVIDGIVYGILTGIVFALMWPGL